MPELKEMDSVYKNVISNLPMKQQISYCEQLIDKAQLTLIRNSKLLNETVEEELKKTKRKGHEFWGKLSGYSIDSFLPLF